MKRNILAITAVIFFLIINTLYFWESKLGFYAMPMTLLLILTYFILSCSLFYQIFLSIKEKFKNRHRIFSIGIVSIVLILVFLKPSGIVNFEMYEGNDLLIAGREGVANCRVILKLKESNKFVEKSVCFGVSETRGDYSIKGDSIFFSNIHLGRGENEYYQFAVIDKSNELKRFKNYKDSLPDFLYIGKNQLKY